MIKGKCVDNTNLLKVIVGEEYFLFPNGENYYYVSKFPNIKAHIGCYQKERFKEVKYAFESNKVYLADLIWRSNGYKSAELKKYFIVSKKSHAFFYHDKDLKKLGGCFPLHWFSNFEEYIYKEGMETVKECNQIEGNEQLSLF